MSRSEKYTLYMNSLAWVKKRAEAINRAHCRCNRCSSCYYLEVHHKTYDRLGDELPSDLEVLCRTCHVIADKERSTRNRNYADAAAFEGWATKVYGNNENGWPHDAEDRFENWLEKKADNPW